MSSTSCGTDSIPAGNAPNPVAPMPESVLDLVDDFCEKTVSVLIYTYGATGSLRNTVELLLTQAN